MDGIGYFDDENEGNGEEYENTEEETNELSSINKFH